MAARASESPETTAQLVELIGYIQDCRDCAMFDLREKARTTAEYVLFLMQHAHLHCTDVFLQERSIFDNTDSSSLVPFVCEAAYRQRVECCSHLWVQSAS